MSQLYLTSEELMNQSAQLSALEGEVMSVFNEMRGRMDAVAGVWQSPAGDALQDKFARLSPSFDAFCQRLEGFATFLHNTAEDYQENESMLSVNGL